MVENRYRKIPFCVVGGKKLQKPKQYVFIIIILLSGIAGRDFAFYL